MSVCTNTSGGAGCFAEQDGLILTANHFVSDTTTATVWYRTDGSVQTSGTGHIVWRDVAADLAIVRIEGQRPRTRGFLKIADPHQRLGSDDQYVLWTWNDGLTSAPDYLPLHIRTSAILDSGNFLFLQCGAVPGWSGSPVLDKAGHLAAICIGRMSIFTDPGSSSRVETSRGQTTAAVGRIPSFQYTTAANVSPETLKQASWTVGLLRAELTSAFLSPSQVHR